VCHGTRAHSSEGGIACGRQSVGQRSDGAIRKKACTAAPETVAHPDAEGAEGDAESDGDAYACPGIV